MQTLTLRHTFEAAHRITGYPTSEYSLHGHSYKLYITVSSDKQSDYIYDASHLRAYIKHLLKHIDHSELNKVIDNPTVENIVLYIIEVIEPTMKELDLTLEKVELWQTEDLCSTWVRGD